MVASFFTNVTKFTAVSAGTGNFVVSAAVTGYQTPATATAVSNATYSYRAESTDLTQWEVGTGVYTSSNVTLTRVPSINSAGGSSAINFTAAPQVGLVVLTPDIMRPYYFSAYLSSDQVSSASGVSFKVNCNTEVADSNGWYDNAANFRFTPQFAGKYKVSGQVQFSGAAISQAFVDVTKNSTSSPYARFLDLHSSTAGISVITIPISIIMDFNGSTDFVEMVANISSTAATLSFLGGSSPIRTFFEAAYIGI